MISDRHTMQLGELLCSTPSLTRVDVDARLKEAGGHSFIVEGGAGTGCEQGFSCCALIAALSCGAVIVLPLARVGDIAIGGIGCNALVAE